MTSTLATKLANELVEAADEMTLSKTIARYGRVNLLCIDELGYMQLDRRGAELLFHVLTEREENASVAIASNESFGGWTKTFTDPRLCAAIVDRFTFGGTIIETGTDSTDSPRANGCAAEPESLGVEPDQHQGTPTGPSVVDTHLQTVPGETSGGRPGTRTTSTTSVPTSTSPTRPCATSSARSWDSGCNSASTASAWTPRRS
jgi:hypothetical protein